MSGAQTTGVVWVDADACSVKDEIYRVATRYRWRVVVVANQHIQIPRSALISAVRVPEGADVADDFIADKVSAGDVVITSDIPLADRSLKKGARVLGQRGREFTPESIGDALAGRSLGEHLREIGVMTGGPAPMAKKDRSRFLGKLDELINAIQRETKRPA